jgi:hypothetical protein
MLVAKCISGASARLQSSNLKFRNGNWLGNAARLNPICSVVSYVKCRNADDVPKFWHIFFGTGFDTFGSRVDYE